MANVTAKQMREIAELLESSMIQQEILNRSTEEPVIEDDDDGRMSPEEIRQYQSDMDERAGQIEEAAELINQAARMITAAVDGTGQESRVRMYITNRLSAMANSDDGMEGDSIPALINKLRNN